MPKLLISIVLLLCCLWARAQKVVFNYDASGNQAKRQYICVNCPNPVQANTPPLVTTELLDQSNKLGASVDSLKKAKLEVGTVGRTIKAYPNPLKETLTVDWRISEKDIFVRQIDVFNIIGVNSFSKKYAPENSQEQISFISLPPSTYVVVVTYSDNKRETIKIIKQ